MEDPSIGSMKADALIERAKLGKVRDDVAGNILKPETKLPKTPQEGKKASLPLSQKSEVKYSKPIDPDMEKEIVSVYNKRNIKMDSIQEHYNLIKKDLVEEASTIPQEQAVSIEYYKGFGYSNINK